MIVQWSLIQQIEAICYDVDILVDREHTKMETKQNKQKQKHSRNFLLYSWFRLRYLEDDIDFYSV
jgi:hypothetical protein